MECNGSHDSARMACLGVAIKCNFTGREAKQYSGEQGL